jgi:hypothetical protein
VKNPESMNHTPLSFHVKEANVIVGLEAFKILGEAQQRGDRQSYEKVHHFINSRPFRKNSPLIFLIKFFINRVRPI